MEVHYEAYISTFGYPAQAYAWFPGQDENARRTRCDQGSPRERACQARRLRRVPFKLPRSYRLLKADEFSSVFSFRRGASGEFFQLQVRPNGLQHVRLGMVMGKKAARLAVDRNYAKRMVREYFRTNQARFEGLDVVVRLRKALGKTCPAVVRQELRELAERVANVASLDRAD